MPTAEDRVTKCSVTSTRVCRRLPAWILHMRNPTTGARRYQPIGHLLAQKRHWPRGSGTAACHPQRASKQLPPQLGERLLSSDGQAPWNDSHGRRADVDAVNFCRRWFRVPSRGLAEDRW